MSAKRAQARRTPAPRARRFPPALVATLEKSKILGIRAGTEHRFIGVWLVVVDGRVFVKSWTIKGHGWYRTFQTDPLGAIQVGTRTVRIRARPVRDKALLDAIEAAYAEKYHTPGSIKYVEGFKTPERRKTTTELVPGTGTG
jgi:hypothetical protein